MCYADSSTTVLDLAAEDSEDGIDGCCRQRPASRTNEKDKRCFCCKDSDMASSSLNNKNNNNPREVERRGWNNVGGEPGSGWDRRQSLRLAGS